MSGTPTGVLEPLSAPMRALQLARNMFLSSNTRRWHIYWGRENLDFVVYSKIMSESRSGFKLKSFTHVTFQPQLQFLMAENPSMDATERRNTRATNVNQHPGLVQVQQKRKRRTKEEIAHDKALQEEKKNEKKRKQTKSIALIANLEDQMAIDDAGAEGAHPRYKGSLLSFFTILGYLLIQKRY